MVNPPSDSVKPGQHRSGYLARDMRDKKQLRLNGKLSPDHRCRVVPGRVIREHLIPESDDLRLILGFIRPDVHHGLHRGCPPGVRLSLGMLRTLTRLAASTRVRGLVNVDETLAHQDACAANP